MADTQDDKPYSWTVNYIGREGYREYIRVSSSNPDDLASKRSAVLKFLTDDGAVSDVRKLFDDNGTKPGKLAQSAEKVTGGPDKPSKLARFAKPAADEKTQTADEVVAALKASGFLSQAEAETVAEATGAEKPVADAVVTTAVTNASSKLAKFAPKPAAAPAPKPTQAGPVSAPNVSPKLARFVAREKKSE